MSNIIRTSYKNNGMSLLINLEAISSVEDMSDDSVFITYLNGRSALIAMGFDELAQLLRKKKLLLNY